MGNSCGVPEEMIIQSDPEEPSNTKTKTKGKHHKKDKQGKKFEDFEEYGNGKTIGQGIKQIPSYKCPIPYDKLNELRDEFWKSKTTNRSIWKMIKECCTTDYETAEVLLEAGGLACNGSLREVFLLTNPDMIFKVPNFCVCDPSFERDYDGLAKSTNKVTEKTIKVVCFLLTKNKDYTLECTNKTKVKDLKDMFSKKAKLNSKEYSIRFLFKGQELLDDHLLCFHDIENMSKIQVMARKLED